MRVTHASVGNRPLVPELSRRNFGRILSLLSAGAALPISSEQALAQLSMVGRLPPGAVKINANENPMGPCAEAMEAIRAAVESGGRYMFEEAVTLSSTIADVEAVRPDYVLVAAGSSDLIHKGVLAFTSPAKPLVIAEPGYEAPAMAASAAGAKTISVPLTSDYRHDVRAMAAASKDTGLIYLCNPNNPTGTLTPKADIEWLAVNKPAGAVLMIDEAYIHLSHSAAPMVPLTTQGKDVIILRTFSKLYGMAGLRAGAAIARPDLLDKIRAFGTGPMPSAGMVGATASLKVKSLVPERRRIIREIREDVFNWLDQKKYAFIPSESNKFMIDVKRPGAEIIRALAAERVYIGRTWPVWPTRVRVSVGTREEMARFKQAFEKVMSA